MTTIHLSTTRRAILMGHVRSWLYGRDPLAAALTGAIIVLALGRALYLAAAGTLPTMADARAQPTPALTILVATPTPGQIAPTPTIDHQAEQLAFQAAQIAALQAQQAELEQQLAAAQQQPPIVVYQAAVENAAPTPPPAAEPTPPPAPPADQQAERQLNIQSRLANEHVGGSGETTAPDFDLSALQPAAQPASADMAARWCAAAASTGHAQCASEVQP